MNRGMCEFDVCNGNTEESYTTPGGGLRYKNDGGARRTV